MSDADTEFLQGRIMLNKQIFEEFGKYLPLSDEIVNAIENLINKSKEQEKIIELMVKELVERTEACPYDLFNYKIENCDEVCGSIKIEKCFIEYYKNKAKELKDNE